MQTKSSWQRAAAVTLAVTIGSAARAAETAPTDAQIAPTLQALKETDKGAQPDWGFGPGVKTPSLARRVQSSLARAFSSPAWSVPQAGPDAGTKGFFGAPVSYPLIPIHIVLLPDGRVMSYGTNADGQQSGQFIYDVWDPALGTDSSAHLVLPNQTGTDIFCSAQSVMWANGDVFVTGGDLTVNGKRNYAAGGAQVFDPTDNSLRPTQSMAYTRWYPSIVPLTNGEMFVIGGLKNKIVNGQITGLALAANPEIFNPNTGWRTLLNGNSPVDWYYPRAFLAPGGFVLVIDQNGKLWRYGIAGAGSVKTLTQTVPLGANSLPTVMFARGKLLSVRAQSKAVVIDINGTDPVVTSTASLSQERFWASGTLMADGKVLVSGGSSVANSVTGTAYHNEIWNPATGQWSIGASATKPRLYHSNALLLPDGSVWTGGGGAPGPLRNLNAEIYYPPYLYKQDGSGQPAARPTVSGVPVAAKPGSKITFTVGADDQITRVNLLRTGSATHSTNQDQRFASLSFTQTGQQITATIPNDPATVFPGYHMLFAVNDAGVPAVAPIVRIVP